jgi:hypothetical protein
MQQNLTGKELMSYSNGNLMAGGETLGACNIPNNYGYWDNHYHYYQSWYPNWHICEKSKVEQAFKIVGKLLEKDLIEKELTVKQFMKLVNEIAEIV